MTKISRLAEVARRRVRAGEDAEQGFTLIELLVVLLIIGILLAIAIPTFLSVTKSANDTAAQSNLQTALTGAKSWFEQHNQSYSGIQLNSVDINISTVSGTTNSNGTNVVSVDQTDAAGISGQAQGTAVALASYSAGSHVCWGIVDLTGTPAATFDGLTQAGTSYLAVAMTTAAGCTGKSFATAVTNVNKKSGFSTSGFQAVANNENMP